MNRCSNEERTAGVSIGKLVVRVVAIVIAGGSAFYSVYSSFRWTKAASIHVSTTGSWLLPNGMNLQRAYPTIQQALDRARPGDKIVIHDGVYRERLHVRHGGTKEQPLVVEALNPGKVTVTWEYPLKDALRSEWQLESDGIYSAKTQWPIYRVQQGDTALHRVVYGGLPQLTTLIRKQNAWNSFCYENGRIYIWVQGEHPLPLHQLSTHGRAPDPREWGEFRAANLTVESNHVEISGLKFEFGIGASVMLQGSNHVTVKNCSFSGATYGTMSVGENTGNGDLKLQRCFYHNYPQYEWLKNWLTWNEIYVGYSSSSLIATDYDDVVVKDCLAAHVGDAIRITNSGQNSHSRSNIRGNLFAFGTDDAFEIEGAACHINVDQNLVYEFHESLGLSPVELGPVTITGNLFLHPTKGINGAQVKLINREHVERGIRNVFIQKNVFVGDWLCWSEGSVERVSITQNAFVVFNQTDPRWPTGVEESENTYIDRSAISSDSDNWQSSEFGAVFSVVRASSPNSEAIPRIEIDAGPSWLDLKSHPATRLLYEVVTDLKSDSNL